MAQLKDLLVNGATRLVGKLFANEVSVTKINDVTVGSSPKFTDTTYSSKSATSGGTDVSLVTTGEKYTWNNKSNFSGNYNDLTNKPTIPSAPGTLNTNNTSAQATSSSEALSGTINLHKVSKTGSYNDLNNKPTIPAAVTESTVSGWGFTKNTGTITADNSTPSNPTPVNADLLNNQPASYYMTVTITDTGGYFSTDTVNGALQEIGAELSGINTLLGTGVFS